MIHLAYCSTSGDSFFLMVFLLLGINQMLVHFIKQTLGADSSGFSYLWPALTSALVWPVLCVLLDNLNRKLG